MADPVLENIWGLPVELAVGLIGLFGAFVGAGIAAWVTWRVGQGQRRHEVTLATQTRIRDRAATALTAATALAVASSLGKVTADHLYQFQEATTLLRVEAAATEPALSDFAATANVQAIEEAGVGVGRGAESALALMPEGLAWKDLWAIAMTTREGVLGWLSGDAPKPNSGQGELS